MIFYHGGPITPETCALRAWSRRHAFVSYAAPSQIALAASVSQSFGLDNGAFSLWRAGKPTDWAGYYRWTERWLRHPSCDWAIIPDVIGGTEDENDALLQAWPHGDRGVPVWHLDESRERLLRLATAWPRVALGSAAEWDVRRPARCLERLYNILPVICDSDGFPMTKLHGLRMLNPKLVTALPLSSADSTNVARNIRFDVRWKGSYPPATREARVDVLIDRIESHQSPLRLEKELLSA